MPYWFCSRTLVSTYGGNWMKKWEWHLSPSLQSWNFASKAGSQLLAMALRIALYCLLRSQGSIPDGEAIASISAFCSSLSFRTRGFPVVALEDAGFDSYTNVHWTYQHGIHENSNSQTYLDWSPENQVRWTMGSCMVGSLGQPAPNWASAWSSPQVALVARSQVEKASNWSRPGRREERGIPKMNSGHPFLFDLPLYYLLYASLICFAYCS